MIRQILSHFTLSGTLLRSERFGSGLINDTHLCEFREGNDLRKYILQRINTFVFRQPERVMENVEIVTDHIVDRIRARGFSDPYASTPSLVRARDGRSYHRESSGGFWRVFHFIEAGAVYDSLTDAGHAYEIGRGLGQFQSLVSDLSPERLHDTLPGFHHTPLSLAEYDAALSADQRGRVAGIAGENAFVVPRRPLAPLVVEMMRSGALPTRVVHNDPKVNNIMIHKETGEALCMLDLDTVKPGTVLFDFGDCVRSAANRAGEDAEDLGSVKIDLPLFEAVTRGYLREAGSFLSKRERAMLTLSVKVITFELGLRFLADYLRGDTYFKISRPLQNLHRARVQFRLLESIEKAEEKMQSIVLSHAGELCRPE